MDGTDVACCEVAGHDALRNGRSIAAADDGEDARPSRAPSSSRAFEQMKSFGKQAAGARLERMQGSPLWTGNGFPEPAPRTAGPARYDCANAHDSRIHLRRRAARTAGAPALGQPARKLGYATRERSARHLARPLDRIDRDRGPAGASPTRSGAPVRRHFRSWGPKRFQPVPVPLRSLPPVDLVVVSHDHYDHLDYPTIRELAKRHVPFVTSLGVGAHLEAWGVLPQLITELDWWESHTLTQHRAVGDRRTVATFFRPKLQGPQHHLVVLARVAFGAPCRILQRRHGSDHGISVHPRAAGAIRPGHVGSRRLPPGMGRYASWAAQCPQGAGAPGGQAFLPVHWGTFNLAMHAWDQPAEALLQMSAAADIQLLMPLLGEPVEPQRGPHVEPWWRSVDHRYARRGTEAGCA